MLQTDTHRNALRLNLDLGRSKIAIHITGTMSGSQNHRSTVVFLRTRLQVDSLHTYHLVALQDEAGHLGLEMHLTATLENGIAHILDDTRQLIGTDMRMGISQDIRIGSMLTEHIQYLIHTTTLLAAGIEFAVAIGTCATLTKTVVALAIHLLGLGDIAEVFLALTHILATLQHHRSVTQFDEFEGSKETARSLSHHDDTRLTAHVGIFRMDILVVLRKLIDIGTHLEIDKDGALAGIDASLEYPHLVECSHIQPLFLGEIALDAFLARCLFWQNSDLIFLDHIVRIFLF